jgi:hypothetical protein
MGLVREIEAAQQSAQIQQTCRNSNGVKIQIWKDKLLQPHEVQDIAVARWAL